VVVTPDNLTRSTVTRGCCQDVFMILFSLKKPRKNYTSLNRSSVVEPDKTKVTRKGLRAHTILFLQVIRCYLALGPLHIFRRLNVPLFAALHNAIAVTLLDRAALLLFQLMPIGSIGSLQHRDLHGDSSIRFATKHQSIEPTKRNNQLLNVYFLDVMYRILM